ncbi:MAG: adventurous gliding motility protein CglE [Deltaproteobacteria bacterium]|nr:adventurous gliding motility protein CglE [Deltaproteobacteria bacterium]
MGVLLLVVSLPAVGAAEELKASPAAAAAATTAPPAVEAPAKPEEPPAAMLAVVRGLYVEGRVGGGYMVKNAPFKPDPAFPLAGGSEGLGPGSLVHLAAGYDLTPFLAIEAVGGATLVSGTRTDKVRDLGVLFGGLGARGAIDVGDRLKVLVSAGVAYASAKNEVEKADKGVAAMGGVGVEYYVHVRHFSVGVELSVFAPVSPLRVFVGLAPQVKYTF